MNFYDEIRQHIADEASDNQKYMQLAEAAPTEKAKKILMYITKKVLMKKRPRTPQKKYCSCC